MSFRFSNIKWGKDDLGRASGEITWSMSIAGLSFDTSRFALSDFQNALQAAFDAWESVANLTFRQITGDADMDIGLDNLGGPNGTVGQARYSYRGGENDGDGIDTFTEARIVFDTQDSWTPYNERGGVNFYAVAVHEIGHALGLDHVNDRSEIMNPVIAATTLGDGDIEGIQLIYGPRVAGTSGNDRVSFAAETVGQRFDGGRGNDDVTGGSGRDVFFGGAGNDNIAGRNGGDTLIDTLGNNTLSGDGGDDVIIGGSGRTQGTGGSGADILIGGIGNDNLSGGAGNDTIRGDIAGSFLYGDDRITAGSGTDYLEGGGGRDTFVFGTSEGTNYIAELDINQNNSSATRAVGADFDSGIDVVDLNGFGYRNASEVFDHVTTQGGHAVFSDQGTTIHFIGLQIGDLTTDDFLL